MSRAWCALVLVAGCSGGDSPAPPAQPPAVAPPDAALLELQPSGTYDPTSGRHLDDDAPPPPVAPPPRDRSPRAQRPIELTLRSAPPGAMAAVDGVQIGATPTYWSGDANGRVHEFTFVSPHYSVARYRFVPITSGILYAHLDSVAGEELPPDAGASPIPLAVPSVAPPAPPPTVIAPPPRPRPDAAVAPPPSPDAAAEPSAVDVDAGDQVHVGPSP